MLISKQPAFKVFPSLIQWLLVHLVSLQSSQPLILHILFANKTLTMFKQPLLHCLTSAFFFFTFLFFFLHMKMTVVFRGQMCGQSVMLSHSAHRNSLAEWPVERREHCDQDMAHSTPPAPTYISHWGLYIIRAVTAKITSAGVEDVKIHFVVSLSKQ